MNRRSEPGSSCARKLKMPKHEGRVAAPQSKREKRNKRVRASLVFMGPIKIPNLDLFISANRDYFFLIAAEFHRYDSSAMSLKFSSMLRTFDVVHKNSSVLRA